MVEISIKDLTVDFTEKKQTVRALDKLSAVFPANKFNVIVGYSGSGKTTLLRVIAGLIDYDGEVCFDGACVDDLPTAERNLSFVSQQYSLYSNLTIFDNIAFPLKLKGASAKEIRPAVNDVAEKLGISCCLTRKPKHISGGQQQRAAIARALVKRPAVCLMDEPLSNVDPQLRGEVRIRIKNALSSLSCTAIYVTHDFQEAMALADNLYVMRGGEITVFGTPTEVFKSDDETVKGLRSNGGALW